MSGTRMRKTLVALALCAILAMAAASDFWGDDSESDDSESGTPKREVDDQDDFWGDDSVSPTPKPEDDGHKGDDDEHGSPVDGGHKGDDDEHGSPVDGGHDDDGHDSPVDGGHKGDDDEHGSPVDGGHKGDDDEHGSPVDDRGHRDSPFDDSEDDSGDKDDPKKDGDRQSDDGTEDDKDRPSDKKSKLELDDQSKVVDDILSGQTKKAEEARAKWDGTSGNDVTKDWKASVVGPDMARIYNTLAERLGEAENFAKVDTDTDARHASMVIGKFSKQLVFTPPRTDETNSAERVSSAKIGSEPSSGGSEDADGGDKKPKPDKKPSTADSVAKFMKYLADSNALVWSNTKIEVVCDKKRKMFSDSSKVAFGMTANAGFKGFGFGFASAGAFKKDRHRRADELTMEAECVVRLLTATLNQDKLGKLIPVSEPAHRAWLALPDAHLSEKATKCSAYEEWFDFFNMYGTHFVDGVQLGGSITITAHLHDIAQLNQKAAAIQAKMNGDLKKLVQSIITGIDFDPTKLAEAPLEALKSKSEKLRTLANKLDQNLELTAGISLSGGSHNSFDRNVASVDYSINGGDATLSPIVESEGKTYVDAKLFLDWQESLWTHPSVVNYNYKSMSDLHTAIDDGTTEEEKRLKAESYEVAKEVYLKIARRFNLLHILSRTIHGRIEAFSEKIQNAGLDSISGHELVLAWVEYRTNLDELKILEDIETQMGHLDITNDVHMTNKRPSAKSKRLLDQAISSLQDKADGDFAEYFGNGVLTSRSPQSLSKKGIVAQGDVTSGTIDKWKNKWTPFSRWHSRYVEVGTSSITWWEKKEHARQFGVTVRSIPYEVIAGVIDGLPKDKRGGSRLDPTTGFQIVTYDRVYIFRVENEATKNVWLAQLTKHVDKFLIKSTEVPLYDELLNKEELETVSAETIIQIIVPNCVSDDGDSEKIITVETPKAKTKEASSASARHEL